MKSDKKLNIGNKKITSNEDRLIEFIERSKESDETKVTIIEKLACSIRIGIKIVIISHIRTAEEKKCVINNSK